MLFNERDYNLTQTLDIILFVVIAFEAEVADALLQAHAPEHIFLVTKMFVQACTMPELPPLPILSQGIMPVLSLISHRALVAEDDALEEIRLIEVPSRLHQPTSGIFISDRDYPMFDSWVVASL